LYAHLNSRILEISVNDWELVAFLPLDKFVGESRSKVQKLSLQSIKGSKESYINESNNSEENVSDGNR
jgi:hypothetical protein